MCAICGIVNTSNNKQVKKELSKLLHAGMSRGVDATGIGYLNGRKEFVVQKQPVPANQFNFTISGNPNIIIGHNRAASQGRPENNYNNHPVLGDRAILVHNGSVCGDEDKRKLLCQYEVDTELILRLIEFHYNDTNDIKEAIARMAKELVGSQTCALLHKDYPTTIWLWRHHNPLWLAYDRRKDVIYFASTKQMIAYATGTTYYDFFTYPNPDIAYVEVDNDTLIEIETSPCIFITMHPLEFKTHRRYYYYEPVR